MQISPITTYTSVGFQGNNRRVTDKTGALLYKTTTYFFRNDLDWDKFINLLISKYQNTPRVNLIDHICSNGPETYSLIMKLLTRLGINAEKFFPIQAKDINKENILSAQNGGGMGISNEDIYRINYYTNNNINNFLNFKPSQNPEHQLAVTAKPILKNRVQFSQGDIFQDIENIPGKNTVLLCRNFWMYLKEDECELLAKKLGSKFDNTSLIVLGEHDINKSRAAEYLKKYGFIPLSIPYVYSPSA